MGKKRFLYEISNVNGYISECLYQYSKRKQRIVHFSKATNHTLRNKEMKKRVKGTSAKTTSHKIKGKKKEKKIKKDSIA